MTLMDWGALGELIGGVAIIVSLIYVGVQDISAINGADRLRLWSYFHKFVRPYENAHYQFVRGALEPEVFTGLSKQFIFLISLPGSQVYWQERKSW